MENQIEIMTLHQNHTENHIQFGKHMETRCRNHDTPQKHHIHITKIMWKTTEKFEIRWKNQTPEPLGKPPTILKSYGKTKSKS